MNLESLMKNQVSFTKFWLQIVIYALLKIRNFLKNSNHQVSESLVDFKKSRKLFLIAFHRQQDTGLQESVNREIYS